MLEVTIRVVVDTTGETVRQEVILVDDWANEDPLELVRNAVIKSLEEHQQKVKQPRIKIVLDIFHQETANAN